MIFQEESGDIDTEPSFLCDGELDDEIVGKALSSPLFIQERQEPADRRQAYHSHEESLLSAQSFFAPARTGGFSLKDEKSKFSLTLEPRFRNTNFKPILIEEVFWN